MTIIIDRNRTPDYPADANGTRMEIGSSVDLIGGTGFDCGVVYAVRRYKAEWIVSWRPGHAQGMPRATESVRLVVRS